MIKEEKREEVLRGFTEQTVLLIELSNTFSKIIHAMLTQLDNNKCIDDMLIKVEAQRHVLEVYGQTLTGIKLMNKISVRSN